MRLVLVPKNGLANRIRAIEAGAAFCARNQCRFAVEWWREPDCNAEFAALFEPPSSFALRERAFQAGRVGRFQRGLLKTAYLALGYRWIDDADVLWWDHQAGRQALAPWRRIVADRRRLPTRCSRLVLRTHRAFAQPALGWTALQPRCELLAESRAVLSRAGAPPGAGHWIGVHIRRADHAAAKQHSPTVAFIDAIEWHLAERPGALLFLATDSPAEESALRQRFGPRLVTAAKQHWQRSTSDGVRAAMIDLLCLSLCDVILGSYWSSFSDVAARLGGTELEVVRAAD